MCLVSTPKDLMLSNLTKTFQTLRITHLNMTATSAALIKAEDLPLVKCFITSGEPSSRLIIQNWGPRKLYYNAYGPTETTNVCTARLVDSVNIYASSIGRMLSNSSGFVLGPDLETLPIFAVGELFVGGAQVIQGYLGDDEKTRQSFLNHESYGRIYKTGDVSCCTDDFELRAY